jgi:hypothetical protein
VKAILMPFKSNADIMVKDALYMVENLFQNGDQTLIKNHFD